MKTAKSNRSLRSIKSARSMKSTRTNLDSKRGDAGGEFLDIGTTLPLACARFQCPYNIVVIKEQQQDEFYKILKHGEVSGKRKKLSIMPTQPIQESQMVEKSEAKTSEGSKSLAPTSSIDLNTLTVTALYDTYNCLSEILLSRIKVPRVLMQVLNLLVPYFQNLTTITLRRCHIDMYILHELGKMFELSTITAVCLDESPVSAQNYTDLLNEPSNLRSLSLCRCKINDDVCKLIATKLHHGAPAENLQLLNLSSNHITDTGAKYLSEALRSNRRLRFLNLADNRINDDGAGHILDVLIEFPLTYDEIMNKRIRYMKYLKCKQALFLKYLNDCGSRSVDEVSQLSRKSTPKRKKPPRKDKDTLRKMGSDEDCLKTRAEMLATEMLGHYIDPFDSNSVKITNNYYYCLGNMALSYLNLSYNNLSFLIIKKLQKVVLYQNSTKKPNQCGLTKVVIDGNNLPMCNEIVLLNELFNRNIRNFTSKYQSEMGKRKAGNRGSKS